MRAKYGVNKKQLRSGAAQQLSKTDVIARSRGKSACHSEALAEESLTKQLRNEAAQQLGNAVSTPLPTGYKAKHRSEARMSESVCRAEGRVRGQSLEITPPQPSPSKGGVKLAKAGFTLAEVLITLGIIGVVAAMTIPNLIANTRSQQYRSAFKKAISTLSQAARMSQAQYGYDYAGISTLCKNGATDHPDEVMSMCAILNGTLTGATFISSLSELKVKGGAIYSFSCPYLEGRGYKYNNNTLIAYQLADGIIFGFSKNVGTNPCTLPTGSILADRYDYTGEANQYMNRCVGFIDVNGTSLPNKEVSCSSGSNNIEDNNCIVKNDAQHMTDIFPVRFHDGIVEPATAAARYVLKTAK